MLNMFDLRSKTLWKRRWRITVKWFQQAAKWDDVEIQYYSGHCYLNGLGVTGDYFKAVKWCRLTAYQGNVKAQVILRRCDENGHGVPKYLSKAEKWSNNGGSRK